MEISELKFVASVVDSSGSFMIKKRGSFSDRNSCDVLIRFLLKQPSDFIVGWIHQKYGGHKSFRSGRHSVELSSQKALVFLKDVVVELVVKKRQAEILIELQERIGDRLGNREVVSEDRADRTRDIRYLTKEEIEHRLKLVDELRSLHGKKSVNS